MSLRLDWRGLIEILEDQKKLNEEVLKRLKALESKLTKLEKKVGTRAKKEP